MSEVGSVHTSQIRVVNTDAQAQYQDEFQTQFSTLCGLRALDHLNTRVCLEGGNYRGFGLKLGFPDELGFRTEGETRGLYFSDLEGYLVPCGYLAPMEPEIETVHVPMNDDDDLESSADSTDVVVNNHTHFDDEVDAVPMEAEPEVVAVPMDDEANEIMEQMTALKSAINHPRQPAYDPMDTECEPDDTPMNVVESDVESDDDDDDMEVENTPEYVTTPPLMMPLLTEEVIDTPAQSPVVPPTPDAPLKKEKKVKTKKPKKSKKNPDSTPKEPEVVDFETIFKDHLAAVGLLDDFNGEATEDAQYHPQGVYVGWEHDKISALKLRLEDSGYQSEIISEEDYEEEKWLVVRQMADI
jgi:cell division septation protein DedD